MLCYPQPSLCEGSWCPYTGTAEQGSLKIGTSICLVNETWASPDSPTVTHHSKPGLGWGCADTVVLTCDASIKVYFGPCCPLKPLSPRWAQLDKQHLGRHWPFLLPWWQMFLTDMSKCVLSTPSLLFRVSFYWLVQAGKSEPKVITFSLFHKVPGPNIF